MENPRFGLAERPVLMALGSNLGSRLRNLRKGLQDLTADGRIVLERSSSLYASDPVDAEGGEFLNAVVRLRTDLDPLEVLSRARFIEVLLGRRGSGHDARPLDLDLLYFGDLRCTGPVLTLPHPRLRSRAFVRFPLAEVCDDLPDPVTGGPIRDWIEPFLETDRRIVRWVRGPEWVRDPDTGFLEYDPRARTQEDREGIP